MWGDFSLHSKAKQHTPAPEMHAVIQPEAFGEQDQLTMPIGFEGIPFLLVFFLPHTTPPFAISPFPFFITNFPASTMLHTHPPLLFLWECIVTTHAPSAPSLLPLFGSHSDSADLAFVMLLVDTLPGKHGGEFGVDSVFLYDNHSLPSPHLADISYIKLMPNAVKKWESAPKHKEMISDSMFHHMARLYHLTSLDSFVKAVTGFCTIEWCNDPPTHFATTDYPHWGDRLIQDDFSSCATSGQCLSHMFAANDDNIMFTTLCIKKQKNNDNSPSMT